MNNSLIQPEPDASIERIQEKMQEREAQIVRIIGAIQTLKQTTDWSTLKTEVFDNLHRNLSRDLIEEASKENPNTNKLNRITGEMKWTERYSDFDKWENALRVELQGVRKRQHGNTE
jgi:hypothetical protein